MSEHTKIIAVGDFIKNKDKIVDVAVPDPEIPGGTIGVTLRIKKPSPNDTIKIMEFVNNRLGDKMDLVQTDDIMTLKAEERNEAINLAYQYDATLISSSVFFPPEDGDLSKNTEKVFATADKVLDECPNDLFNALRSIVGRDKTVLTEAEAKK